MRPSSDSDQDPDYKPNRRQAKRCSVKPQSSYSNNPQPLGESLKTLETQKKTKKAIHLVKLMPRKNNPKMRKERTTPKQDLADGFVLRNASLFKANPGSKKELVKLYYCPEYDNEIGYGSINKVFYDLSWHSSEFINKFEKVTQGPKTSFLTLKKNHGFKNDDEVIKFLEYVAKKKEKLQAVELLATGQLLKSVELIEKKYIKLNFFKEFQAVAFSESINRSLNALYKRVKEFKQNFETPKVSNKPSFLILKSNRAYKSGAEVKEALIKFANNRKKAYKLANKPLLKQKRVKHVISNPEFPEEMLIEMLTNLSKVKNDKEGFLLEAPPFFIQKYKKNVNASMRGNESIDDVLTDEVRDSPLNLKNN